LNEVATMQPRVKPDITRWYVAAALFWFEALGFMALGAAFMLSPFACWGDRFDTPAPANDSCAAGEAPYVYDGSVVAWLAALVVMGLVAVLLWVATSGRPRWRGLGCLALGAAAIAPIVWGATSSALGAMVLFVWTGVPAILLLGAGFRLLNPRPDPSAQVS
jgi:hypothetical protein